MIISRTPFRISFFGGGTDYPAWYLENGGSVLATTIDKYSYISCRYLPPFFEHRSRIVYSKIETVRNVSDIEHPAVRAVLDWAQFHQGVEIHYDGDLPARSGLGSSSAFTVGLINALTALRGKHISRQELADNALHVEQEVIKENVGSQDQICAAFGGFNKISFFRNGSYDVTPLILSKSTLNDLEQRLCLFFTGFSRTASDIAKSKIDNFKNRGTELSEMQKMVDTAIDYLAKGRLESFGKLLHENWMMKRRLSERVSTPKIDEIYDVAMKAGATGGKIIGAGGGGFLLLYVESERQDNVREALRGLIYVPIKFEKSGSKIVLYQPSGL